MQLEFVDTSGGKLQTEVSDTFYEPLAQRW
jgi:hypothetical protein